MVGKLAPLTGTPTSKALPSLPATPGGMPSPLPLTSLEAPAAPAGPLVIDPYGASGQTFGPPPDVSLVQAPGRNVMEALLFERKQTSCACFKSLLSIPGSSPSQSTSSFQPLMGAMAKTANAWRAKSEERGQQRKAQALIAANAANSSGALAPQRPAIRSSACLASLEAAILRHQGSVRSAKSDGPLLFQKGTLAGLFSRDFAARQWVERSEGSFEDRFGRIRALAKKETHKEGPQSSPPLQAAADKRHAWQPSPFIAHLLQLAALMLGGKQEEIHENEQEKGNKKKHKKKSPKKKDKKKEKKKRAKEEDENRDRSKEQSPNGSSGDSEWGAPLAAQFWNSVDAAQRNRDVFTTQGMKTGGRRQFSDTLSSIGDEGKHDTDDNFPYDTADDDPLTTGAVWIGGEAWRAEWHDKWEEKLAVRTRAACLARLLEFCCSLYEKCRIQALLSDGSQNAQFLLMYSNLSTVIDWTASLRAGQLSASTSRIVRRLQFVRFQIIEGMLEGLSRWVSKQWIQVLPGPAPLVLAKVPALQEPVVQQQGKQPNLEGQPETPQSSVADKENKQGLSPYMDSLIYHFFVPVIEVCLKQHPEVLSAVAATLLSELLHSFLSHLVSRQVKVNRQGAQVLRRDALYLLQWLKTTSLLSSSNTGDRKLRNSLLLLPALLRFQTVVRILLVPEEMTAGGTIKKTAKGKAKVSVVPWVEGGKLGMGTRPIVQSAVAMDLKPESEPPVVVPDLQSWLSLSSKKYSKGFKLT